MKPTNPLHLTLLALGTLTLAPASMASLLYQDSFNRDGGLGGSTPDITTDGATWAGSGTTSTANGGQLVFEGDSFLPFVPTAGNIYTLSYQLDDPDGIEANLWCGFSRADWMDYAGSWITEIRPVEGDNKTTPQGGDSIALTHGITTSYQVVLDTYTNPLDWSATMYLDGVAKNTVALGDAPGITSVYLIHMGNTGAVMTNFSLTDNLTAVPEPGSLLALGCLIGSGALLRSRRR